MDPVKTASSSRGSEAAASFSVGFVDGTLARLHSTAPRWKIKMLTGVSAVNNRRAVDPGLTEDLDPEV